MFALDKLMIVSATCFAIVRAQQGKLITSAPFIFGWPRCAVIQKGTPFGHTHINGVPARVQTESNHVPDGAEGITSTYGSAWLFEQSSHVFWHHSHSVASIFRISVVLPEVEVYAVRHLNTSASIVGQQKRRFRN